MRFGTNPGLMSFANEEIVHFSMGDFEWDRDKAGLLAKVAGFNSETVKGDTTRALLNIDAAVQSMMGYPSSANSRVEIIVYGNGNVNSLYALQTPSTFTLTTQTVKQTANVGGVASLESASQHVLDNVLPNRR